ncbi:Ulp1 family isopeptidase [Bradyrhizobium sp. WBAH42]|uniref:Ulp1 family isopeptidase n=1 Tax=Bradyrhizobium sp. WBAH42 TaxID=1390132 RepID=UPI00211EA666|nr:Ulp1 family isopeptidase [Bradyrhizobium sp. WBAH42]
MDPYNSDPFNPTAWSQVQHAVLEEDQGGHASQEGFEQHLAEARPPDPGPVSGGGRSGRNYHPHLSAEHRDIIDKAIAQYVAQKNPHRKTVNRYTQALRRLGNDLGANRITINLGDHQSLVRYVKTYFPKDEDMKKGLGVLRAYHDPSYVTSGGRPRTIPSAEDAPLSERLSASGMKPGSAARHDRSLRRFSNALNLAGYSISGLDHATRIEFAQKLFPKDEHLLFALGKVRDDEDVSGAGASREPSGYAVPSPTSHLYPDDARIIDGLEKAELSMLKPEDTSRKKVAQNLARNQRRFGAWLQREGRGSIVSRLTGTSEQQKSLNDDYKDFKKSSRSADMGFDRVRNYLLIVEANAALGVSPEQAGGEPRRGGSNSTWSPHLPHDFEGPAAEAVPDGSSAIYQGLDSFVDLPYTPQAVRDDAQSAPVSGAAARPPLFNGPSDAPAQSSDIFRGLQPFVDLPYTPQQMRDDAQSRPVSGAAAKPPLSTGPSDAPAQSSDMYRGLNSSVDLPYTPQQMRDDAQSAPVGSAAARPPLFTAPSDVPAQSSDIYRGLNSFVDLPYTPQQMRDDAQSAPVGGAGARPALFTEPSDAPAQSSDIYRGLDSFVDLPYTPQQMRDDAQSAPVGSAAARPPLFTAPSDVPAQSSDIYRGLNSFVDLPYTPQQMRDDAQSAPVGGAGARPALFTEPSDAPAQSSDIYRGLDSFVDLPYTPQQMRDDAQSAPVGSAAARPPLFTAPSDVPAQSSDIYRGLNSFVDLPYTPQQMRDDAQSAPMGGAGARPALFTEPSDAPAQSSDIYRGLDSFVDLPYTPQQMRDDAQSAQVLSPAGEPTFFVGRSGVLQELEHIGYRIHEDRQDGSQPVSDLLLDVLNNIGVLPAKFSGPTQVPISGETYSITLGPRGRSGAQFIDHPRPSPVPAAQIAPLATVASSGHRSGPVLGPTQWLGDKHIQWDYQLLVQELQQNNPDLAARTRFVDPLIAQMLRSPSKEVAERALGWVRHDTADFLFLPVSDASATDRHQRGSHWSLLLVDRRDRGRPVAYHYDSTQGYNDRPAAEIAGRLDAYVQQAPIRQQQNGYDCGVFVVDGTRELVRRLAARRPDLNLNNLVISRQDLRDRLGADVGFN